MSEDTAYYEKCLLERDSEIKSLRIEVRAAEARVAALTQENERFKERLGEAEAWLGEYGAGGSAAGLVPAIHNLAHRAEKAESSVAALTQVAEAARIAERDLGDLHAIVESGAHADLIADIRAGLSAALGPKT